MKKIIVYVFAALFTVPTLVNVAYGEPTGSDSSNIEREQKDPLLRMETRGLSQVSTTQNDTEIAIREIGISCSATDIAATNKILEEKGHPLLNKTGRTSLPNRLRRRERNCLSKASC